MPDISYPIRINHYLAIHNVASRRQADRLISEGKVFINGRVAVLGDKVNEGDDVQLAGDSQSKMQERRFFAYHKPQGTVLENSKIKSASKKFRDLVALDRIDKETAGLVIGSNDPDARDLLEHPRLNLSEEFLVKVHRPLGKEFFDRFEKEAQEIKGVELILLEQVSPQGFKILSKKIPVRLLRELCAKLHYEITGITRVGIGATKLLDLKSDSFRELKGAELSAFENELMI